MVKAEGLRGLRAKVRGEGGCDHWGHALTRAHARSCLAEPRTDSTCSTCAVGGPLGSGIRFCWERHFAWMDPLLIHSMSVPAQGRRAGRGCGQVRARGEHTCPHRSTGHPRSLTPKGDLRATGGVMSMGRGAAAARCRRYQRRRERTVMSPMKTAQRARSSPIKSPARPSTQEPFKPPGQNRPVPNLFKISQPDLKGRD